MARYKAHRSVFQNSFLQDEQLQHLMQVLGGTAQYVRVVGGAVRNALRHIKVNDIDLASVHHPDEVIARAEKAGFRTAPTGIAHGTVTIIGKGVHYEVTTLREDIETDGRHAVVRFGTDWQRDMERRDFTMNALCVDRDGVLHDLVSGLEDCREGHVRFIGNAQHRIAEDALRIFRFFRFSAHFGDGALDGPGLAAANEGVSLLSHLSAERIQTELKKTFSAPRADQLSLAVKAGAAIFDAIELGVDGADYQALAKCDRSDWSMRAFILWRHRPEALQLAVRKLKFSKADCARIDLLNEVIAFLDQCDLADTFQVRHAVYRFGAAVIDDALYLLSCFEQNSKHQYGVWAKPLENWQPPIFPVKAADLMQLGIQRGPDLGQSLARLEQIWIEAQFALTRDELLSHVGLSCDKETDNGRI
ncbi:CCA tRNA nucleotidyltransferase [Pararhizobium sp. IMCC21322]|uniref:CCA tRNA nucleotidyltransferase n=1 Tax=Pararhizobium sp. IMCC21322 TaxID=3067903 RepID=UPI00274229CB|nr:CCA tRNA nucleotidyltransferase [Pararhizobium sp. IMCC21322]